MPEHGGQQPNERTKAHLQRTHGNAAQLPESTIAALNDCSQDQLDAMYDVADTLVTADKKQFVLFAIH